jgi:hypothetical protein
MSTCRRLEIDPYLSPCKKTNSKETKHLIVRSETLKLLEENIGETLQNIGTDTDFLGRTPVAQEIKTRIDKWD